VFVPTGGSPVEPLLSLLAARRRDEAANLVIRGSCGVERRAALPASARESFQRATARLAEAPERAKAAGLPGGRLQA